MVQPCVISVETYVNMHELMTQYISCQKVTICQPQPFIWWVGYWFFHILISDSTSWYSCDLRKVSLKDRVWSQYWASWMPQWIAASQWLMSIFGNPMDAWVYTGTLVFLSLRAREYTRGNLRKLALQDGFDHNIGQAERHSELPRPNGWCPFSGTLWTHESTQVLWCSWVIEKGSTQGAISVKYRYKIGFDHNIRQAECYSELPRPNGWWPFSGTLWTHESTQVLWCSWVWWQGSTQGAITVN